MRRLPILLALFLGGAALVASAGEPEHQEIARFSVPSQGSHSLSVDEGAWLTLRFEMDCSGAAATILAFEDELPSVGVPVVADAGWCVDASGEAFRFPSPLNAKVTQRIYTVSAYGAPGEAVEVVVSGVPWGA